MCVIHVCNLYLPTFPESNACDFHIHITEISLKKQLLNISKDSGRSSIEFMKASNLKCQYVVPFCWDVYLDVLTSAITSLLLGTFKAFQWTILIRNGIPFFTVTEQVERNCESCVKLSYLCRHVTDLFDLLVCETHINCL